MGLVHLLYDSRMTKHSTTQDEEVIDLPLDPDDDGYCYENPRRIIHIHRRLIELEQLLIVPAHNSESLLNGETSENAKVIQGSQGGLFLPLTCIPADQSTIELAHTSAHYEWLRNTSTLTDSELLSLTNAKKESDDDVYFCKDTFLAASLACGGVIQCINSITEPNTKSKRAIAVVRPPGHHACEQKAMGFCFFNSVAVGAKHAIATKRAKKVLILDWDVHHGNGTQDITYEDPNIFYISLHRIAKNNRTYFFPGTGQHTEVGTNHAVGTNLNIAWTSGGMGNVEYAAAFSELVLPLLSEWEPDLVMISCGFDAARGDLIGDCDLTPESYHAFTRSIMATVGQDIPIVVALEGGYNIEVIAICMESVALALLDQPCSTDEVLSNENVQPVPKETTTIHSPSSIVDLPTNSMGALKLEQTPKEGACERLQIGRRELSAYWNHDLSLLARERGKIKATGIICINKSIEAIQTAPIWQSYQDLLHLIPNQKPRPDSSAMRTRRSTRIPSSKSSDGLEDLNSFLQGLQLS